MTIGYNDPGFAQRNPAEYPAPEFTLDELGDDNWAELFWDIAPEDESQAVAAALMKYINGESRNMTMAELLDECLSQRTINTIWRKTEEKVQKAGMERLSAEAHD